MTAAAGSSSEGAVEEVVVGPCVEEEDHNDASGDHDRRIGIEERTAEAFLGWSIAGGTAAEDRKADCTDSYGTDCTVAAPGGSAAVADEDAGCSVSSYPRPVAFPAHLAYDGHSSP